MEGNVLGSDGSYHILKLYYTINILHYNSEVLVLYSNIYIFFIQQISEANSVLFTSLRQL